MIRSRTPAEAGASLRSSQEALQSEGLDFFLTKKEVELITGRRQSASQRRHLRRMGIPFRVDADGRPIVTRANFARHNDQDLPSVEPRRINMPVRDGLKGPTL